MLKIEQIDHIPDGSFMDCLFITCGTFITIAKVTRLEQVINEDPKDLIARLQVIGFYFHQLLQVQARSASRFPAINISESAASARHPHVLWMIDHRPSDFVCGTPQLTYQPIQRLYEETKAHWLRQIRRRQRIQDSSKMLLTSSCTTNHNSPKNFACVLRRRTHQRTQKRSSLSP